MSEKVITFPASGTRIALYTETKMFIGTLERKEPLPDCVGLWLRDVIVLPITGHVPVGQELHLDEVCVLWSRVIAFGDAPRCSGPGIDG